VSDIIERLSVILRAAGAADAEANDRSMRVGDLLPASQGHDALLSAMPEQPGLAAGMMQGILEEQSEALRIIELSMDIETAFGVEFTEEQIEEFVWCTVGDLADFLARTAAGEPAALVASPPATEPTLRHPTLGSFPRLFGSTVVGRGLAGPFRLEVHTDGRAAGIHFRYVLLAYEVPSKKPCFAVTAEVVGGAGQCVLHGYTDRARVWYDDTHTQELGTFVAEAERLLAQQFELPATIEVSYAEKCWKREPSAPVPSTPSDPPNEPVVTAASALVTKKWWQFWK